MMKKVREMEKKTGKKIKVTKVIGKIILGIIATTGLISMAVLAPNAVRALDLFYDRKKGKYYTKSYVNITVARLKDRGLIEFKERDGKTFIQLTEKGQRELLRYQMRDKILDKPSGWDKKWRVVIFDIKEQARNLREGLRKELSNLGFVRLQNSVWVYPYECEDIIGMLKIYFEIGYDVLYLTVEKIENDEWLKKEFNLR